MLHPRRQIVSVFTKRLSLFLQLGTLSFTCLGFDFCSLRRDTGLQ